jgi:N-acetylmuramic acid 6-phosphate etherase
VVLDAAECPPTFCTSPEQVQGIIAGGAGALVRSSEDLEDRAEDGMEAVAHHHVTELDVVVGITAGGTTPYVHGALQAARQRGATTIFVACVPAEQVSAQVDIDIRLLVGPEILAGSTRLKAGTVTKLALNILSTGTMVKLGKVYGNRMIDVAVTNKKLHDRALRILQDLTDLNREDAGCLLEQSGRNVKLALLMHWTGLRKEDSERLLAKHQGNLRKAISIASMDRNEIGHL